MTTVEFSNEFDVLYNNIMSNQAPGLDEYEKSVFLTKAQNEIIKNYFSPKGNKYREGFDDSEKRQIDFSNITVAVKQNKRPDTDPLPEGYAKFDARSKLYSFPTNSLFILSEQVHIITEDKPTVILNVIPVNYAYYNVYMAKPYKFPPKNIVWRLLMSEVVKKEDDGETINKYVELISPLLTEDAQYYLRYVRKPQPIILADLAEADEEGILRIDGKYKKSECELDSILHPEILQRAVELAKAAYVGDVKSSVELGQRSE